jgi:hypothetical protein
MMLAPPADLCGRRCTGEFMTDRTDNERTVLQFDGELSKLLKAAKRRPEQLWPSVLNQLELAQHQLRSMMHPDDLTRTHLRV